MSTIKWLLKIGSLISVLVLACPDCNGSSGEKDAAPGGHHSPGGSDSDGDNDGDADGDGDGDSDGDGDADANVDAGKDAAPDAGEDLYVGSGNPYEPGPLQVKTVSVDQGQQGAPVPMVIHFPTAKHTYAVIVFQHGFLLSNAYYSNMLLHVTSHGFVVVAPQMYTADGNPIGKPKSTEEAASALKVLAWLPAHLEGLTGAKVDLKRLGLSGHSRGGKVIWTELLAQPKIAIAVAGVDPVDGTGGPLGGEARIADQPFNLKMPSLIIGTGLGPQAGTAGSACAPAGDNHVQFYTESSSPAWHALASEYGHLDMLNDQTPGCNLTCAVCPSGPSRAPMRKFSGGLLVAFFRGALQGDTSGYDWLTDTAAAPIVTQMIKK